jgi:amidohydrolase
MLSLAKRWIDGNEQQLISWRRDLHAHPEVAFNEHRTTGFLLDSLKDYGYKPRRLAVGTGVLCDVGSPIPGGPGIVALRADIDALPLPDMKEVPYRSQNPGLCHACGHDAHTAMLLGMAASLADVEGLPVPIRFIFQPAEERMPGGAQSAVSDGALEGVSRIFALHSDPKLDAGMVGLRAGAITAAFQQLGLALSGPGGHTARPQLTSDLVFALGKLITELPGMLSRRVDPRSALSLVWGAVNAGSAANAIPMDGSLHGTLRMLDGTLWHDLEGIVRELVGQILAPTGVDVVIDYDRGLPAVVNDGALVALQTQAAVTALGADALASTAQSMGGEDFAWYLQSVPGAMARLGVRVPGSVGGDLHQSLFDIDESALAVGVRFTAGVLDEVANVTGSGVPR